MSKLLTLTVEQCILYLQTRVCRSSHRWVCILNLVDSMVLEAQQWGQKLRKRGLRDLLAQAATQLGYVVETIYIRQCEYQCLT